MQTANVDAAGGYKVAKIVKTRKQLLKYPAEGIQTKPACR